MTTEVKFVFFFSVIPTEPPPVDYCADEPCENGGTCYNTTGQYICLCTEQFQGTNCSDGKKILEHFGIERKGEGKLLGKLSKVGIPYHIHTY